MRNVRRHFRLDVIIPAVIKLADQNEMVRLVVPELASGQWHVDELKHDQQFNEYSQALMLENELAGKIICDLETRCKLLCDAITMLVQGECVYKGIKLYKTRRGKKSLAMQLKIGSKTVDILRAFSSKLDTYFGMIDMVIGKSYIEFTQSLMRSEFVFDEMLLELANKGNHGSLFSKLMIHMNDKLARHVTLLMKLRQEISYIVDEDSWPTRQLNLSASGVGFFSRDPYPKFARLLINFRFQTLEEVEVFYMTGNIVSSRLMSGGYYIAVEFTNATEAVQNKMILLLQNEELNQLIAWFGMRRSKLSDGNDTLFASAGLF
jgi:hypothetical protein